MGRASPMRMRPLLVARCSRFSFILESFLAPSPLIVMSLLASPNAISFLSCSMEVTPPSFHMSAAVFGPTVLMRMISSTPAGICEAISSNSAILPDLRYSLMRSAEDLPMPGTFSSSFFSATDSTDLRPSRPAPAPPCEGRSRERRFRPATPTCRRHVQTAWQSPGFSCGTSGQAINPHSPTVSLPAPASGRTDHFFVASADCGYVSS